MKELSTKGMFFNDLDQAERDTLVAVAILQIMHAQPRFDASPNQDGGNVISVYEIHLFCLHMVYIEIINKALDEFTAQWNNHDLSTESNLSPYQLWIGGMVNHCNSQSNAV